MDRTPLLLAAALGLGLVVQLVLPPAPLPLGARQPQNLARLDALATPTAIAAYAAILDRPLFSPSRAAGDPTLADVAPAGSFALIGAASGAGRASAVIRASGGSIHVVGVGDALLGWRVSAVGREDAVVSRGGVSQTLKLGAPARGTVGARPPQTQASRTPTSQTPTSQAEPE